jgi:excisionase family DNA binding protein
VHKIRSNTGQDFPLPKQCRNSENCSEVLSRCQGHPLALEEFLTVEDLCNWLKISKNTIYKWRALPDPIPAIRVGKYLRFVPSEVLAWLGRRP